MACGAGDHRAEGTEELQEGGEKQMSAKRPRCGARLGAAPTLGTSTPGMGTGLPRCELQRDPSCFWHQAASWGPYRLRCAPAQLPASWGMTNREGKKALNKWKWAEHPPQGPCRSADLAAPWLLGSHPAAPQILGSSWL